jgi:hypothetical protein
LIIGFNRIINFIIGIGVDSINELPAILDSEWVDSIVVDMMLLFNEDDEAEVELNLD